MSRLAPLLAPLLAAGALAAPARSAQDEPEPAPREERNVDSLFEGALIGARDGADFGETPGQRRLLELVARYGEADLRARATRELDVAAVLARPDEWRGEIVRLRGLVAGLEAVRLAAPIGPFEDAYRAIVTESDGSEGVVVDFLLEPPALDLQRDVVELEGIFYRTVGYENRRGDRVEAPWLIARAPRRLDEEALPRRTALDGLGRLLLGAGACFLVIRILVQVRRARRERGLSRRGASEIRARATRIAPERP